MNGPVLERYLLGILLQVVAICTHFQESLAANVVNVVKQIYELHLLTSIGMCKVRYWRLFPWSVCKPIMLCVKAGNVYFNSKIAIPLTHILQNVNSRYIAYNSVR